MNIELLKDQIAKVWRMLKVIVAVCHWAPWRRIIQLEYMKRIGVNVRLEVIQKTALLATAKR